MPTSPDGILTCTFDAERLAVQIQVDGAAWPLESDVQRVTITRSSAGQGTIPVRDLERRAVAGGTLLWVDNEAPADTAVTYSCTGYDSFGEEVPGGPSEVAVSTLGAAAGLWVKIPGRADMVTRVGLVDAGELVRATLGGSWQVPGGVAIAQAAAASLAQSAGLGSLSTTLQVLTRDAGQTAALWQIVGQAPGQVLLLQTVPQPGEFPSGYYQVQNPRQGTVPVSPDLYGKRPFLLPVVESVMPAGSGTGAFGATHDDIAQSFSSHTEIAATVSSHLELAEGSWA
jgi:hypothetical protein